VIVYPVMQKCPFEAIQIINLPKDLDKDTTHRYGPNTFKLHRLVACRPAFTCSINAFSRKKKKKKKKQYKINNVLAGYQSRGLGKFLAWLEQMVLASPLLSKFWLENSNLIWVDSM